MSVVEVTKSKGCSRLWRQAKLKPMGIGSPSSDLPFEGVVMCVTGLSKEARNQVMEATRRLGGFYTPTLHPHCTHLVVQRVRIVYSFGGRKFEHALKHNATKNGLFIVTLGWFIDSVRNNARLCESLYSVADFNVQPATLSHLTPTFSPHYSLYVDIDISPHLRNKVIAAAVTQGAALVHHWFVGCHATHVVCEASSIRKYFGHSSNIVSPLWVLKTTKEKHLQRLVHMSPDLARQVNSMLEDFQCAISGEVTKSLTLPDEAAASVQSLEHRQRLANLAKIGVRNRRGRRMQNCQTPMHPITPTTLLDSICWSISEPTSTASIYTNSFSAEDASEHRTPEYFDAKGDGRDSEASFSHLTRPLTESERSEVIFRSNFLTILFPIDGFSEMGPSSATFFSAVGFTCLQVLDHVYAFYQENMAAHEIEAAIHTDSRHADRLRAVYSSKETVEQGYVAFNRIDFLGSRRSLEMLKRVSGDNNSNVYELLIRA